MKRFFSFRYPLVGEDHLAIGKIAKKGTFWVILLTGLISYKRWDAAEQKKKALEKGYEKVDPNKIVPFTENINSINHKKLHKAVIEGGDKFILEEMGYKIAGSPEEYVYHTTKGVSPDDKLAFMSFVRSELNKLP